MLRLYMNYSLPDSTWCAGLCVTSFSPPSSSYTGCVQTSPEFPYSTSSTRHTACSIYRPRAPAWCNKIIQLLFITVLYLIKQSRNTIQYQNRVKLESSVWDVKTLKVILSYRLILNMEVE